MNEYINIYVYIYIYYIFFWCGAEGHLWFSNKNYTQEKIKAYEPFPLNPTYSINDPM